jgi:nitrite reductase (NADH) large subunit
MGKRKLVLVGNGMAGVRCIEEILKVDKDSFDITIFGSEPHPNYNRIMLSAVLQGDTTIDDIVLNSYEWYEQNNIQLFTGETVTRVNTEEKVLFTDQGRSMAYDDLILATGSHPFMLPLPGADLEGVIAFRDIKDCQTMIDTSKEYKKAVVIGGGLLGLEAARGLLNLGMEVDVVHIMDRLMERQLDRTAGELLRKELEQQGMNFLMPKQTERIKGRKRVEKIIFKDGTEADADLVVMAVGIRPNVDVAKESGLEVNRGVIVNDYLETSAPDVYAVGECAEHQGMVYGLVAPLYEQGQVLAKKICGQDASSSGYQGSVLSTQLKVSGVEVFSAGDFNGDEHTQTVHALDELAGVYKKVVLRDNQVIGAVLFGDTKDGNHLLSMINEQADLTGSTSVSLFGSGDGQDAAASVVQMSANATICGCIGVSKGTIERAILEDGLTTVEQIKNCTNASRSCGSCKPLVAELLEHTLGEGYEQEKETMCGCTDLTHEEVVAAIREKGLTHTREVMNVLGWKHDEGCSKCRPAINYYLGMVHPEEYDDDRTSRFVNERMHANIQNDGTYSVVPRMYGGVTNPQDLRKIADVAEKYEVPLIKVTGGQRLDLLGVKKEDLPKIWGELGMPSGYAYAKAIRTVKTCVGEDFCRFGTQDSIGLGIAIEKKFERLNTPHKVKMAVSACPRNCAESGIKDVGVVGVEGAWQIYVGGNGGATLRPGDLLCSVETDQEVLDITAAFLQYYRENAKYLERTSHWVERVGLEHVKQVVVDDKEQRQALIERMEVALSSLPSDPWNEVVNDQQTVTDLYKNKQVEVAKV